VGSLSMLTGDDEKAYWDKINAAAPKSGKGGKGKGKGKGKGGRGGRGGGRR